MILKSGCYWRNKMQSIGQTVLSNFSITSQYILAQNGGCGSQDSPISRKTVNLPVTEMREQDNAQNRTPG